MLTTQHIIEMQTGRRIETAYGEIGEIIQYDPFSSGMCDCLIRRENGLECWYAAHMLKPLDDGGQAALPNRLELIERRKIESIAQLEAIKEKFIREDFHKPWPGQEFGKATIGNAINGALEQSRGNRQ